MLDIDCDALVARLAPHLAVVIEAAVARALGPAHAPQWADKYANPYGSSERFLKAARAGEFATFRRRRRITARWADVAAALERSPGARRRKPKAPASPTPPTTAPGSGVTAGSVR